MTGITLNFAEVSCSSSSSSPLHVSSSWGIPSSWHSGRVHFLAPGDTSSSSSRRCVHCIWVSEHLSRHPSPWAGGGNTTAMCLQSCLHVDIVLLTIDGRLFPLFIGGWPIKLQNLLIQPHGQPIGERFDSLWYVKSVLSYANE